MSFWDVSEKAALPLPSSAPEGPGDDVPLEDSGDATGAVVNVPLAQACPSGASETAMDTDVVRVCARAGRVQRKNAKRARGVFSSGRELRLRRKNWLRTNGKALKQRGFEDSTSSLYDTIITQSGR
jgi:hypothetical protein